MKKILALAAAVTLSASAGLQAAENIWPVGPRSLPPPAHVSRELREIIAAEPAPDVATKRLSARTPEEWKAIVAQIDAPAIRHAEELAKETGARVEEERIAGVHVYRVTPQKIAPEHRNQLFVHVHGGAWVINGGKAGTAEAVLIASCLGIPVLSIDYRMPPDHPAPAAVDDIVSVWREVIKNKKPSRIALGGTSAGANLTLASTLRMKELRLPLPAALMVGTPAVDLAKVGDSRFLNDGVDHGLAWDGLVSQAAAIYAGKQALDDPHLSPIYADVTGFPPTYLISGTRDLLLSDTVAMHRKLRRVGVKADLHVYEGMAHADYAKYAGKVPESDEHFGELKTFLNYHLAK